MCVSIGCYIFLLEHYKKHHSLLILFLFLFSVPFIKRMMFDYTEINIWDSYVSQSCGHSPLGGHTFSGPHWLPPLFLNEMWRESEDRRVARRKYGRHVALTD